MSGNTQIRIPPGLISKGNGNARGRPSKLQSLNYGHKQSWKPKSIVSQVLEEMINTNRISIPIEPIYKKRLDDITLFDHNKTNPNFIESIDFDESHQSEEHIEYLDPKEKYEIKREKKVQPKIYTCDFTKCSYSTKLCSNLEKHKRIHTGEKPYLCDKCSFRTSFSNSLKVHRRLHTKERPYQCSNCNYKCNSVSNLKKHIHSKHKEISASDSIKLDLINKAENT